jgi:hypothetical protein
MAAVPVGARDAVAVQSEDAPTAQARPGSACASAGRAQPAVAAEPGARRGRTPDSIIGDDPSILAMVISSPPPPESER